MLGPTFRRGLDAGIAFGVVVGLRLGFCDYGHLPEASEQQIIISERVELEHKDALGLSIGLALLPSHEE